MATDLSHTLLDESGNPILDESGYELLATFPVPAKITDLQAVRSSNTQVDLDWSDSTNATHYQILRTSSYRGTTTEVAYISQSTKNTNETNNSHAYQDTGLTATTSYRYFVKPVNDENTDHNDRMPNKKSDAAYTPGTNKTL